MEKPYLSDSDSDSDSGSDSNSDSNSNIRAASAVGTVVDKYELVDELGRGGMGVVFKAKHIALPRFVAIKILNQQLSNDLDFRTRFEKEARTASRLDHPHLVSITDYGATEAGEAYLVMDFIDGEALDRDPEKNQENGPAKSSSNICTGL